MGRSSGRDWRLDNAEELHRQHPRSFFIPSAGRRRSLHVDDWVRLLFLRVDAEPGGPSGERMWLTDIRPTERGGYVGVLTNTPAAIQDLAQGDEIEFGPEHVTGVRDPDAPPDSLRAFASRRLIEDDALVPGYVYHDPDDAARPPNRDGDRLSGWCLMVGDETEQEVSDPANLLMTSYGWLLERYPAFAELTREAPVGRAYAWDEDEARYVDVGPYSSAE
jgi:hypothetical protein